MKKLVFLLVVFAGFIACDNESIYELPAETPISEGVTARQGYKVDVCHKAKIINVSINSLGGHLGHGDALDMDGDGYFDIENDCSDTDCDDNDPTINPDAEEICDGIDNNCDGQVDEGCNSCIQDWMDKNLDVTTFRNGDLIPEITNSTDWASATTGAWCYYDFDSNNGPIYGKLYNGYAVTDPRGLAPEGWNLSGEWQTLFDCLSITFDDPSSILQLLSTNGWNDPTNGTNTSGFSIVPGGVCTSEGTFSGLGDGAYYWWIPETGTTLGVLVISPINTGTNSYYAEGGYTPGSSNYRLGLSIRLIKD